jgi:hypothetical protein
MGSNVYYDSVGFKYIQAGVAYMFRINNDRYEWNTATTGTVNGAISFTQAMTLNASGNLSIGNTNDTYKLDVTGSARFNGSGSNGYLYVFGNAGAGGSTNPAYLQGMNFSWNKSNGGGESLITYTNQGGGSNIRFGIGYWNNSTYSEQFSIASTGAATFTSSVTAGSTSSGANFNAYSSSYGNNGLFQSFGTDGNLKLQMGGLGTNEAFFFTGGFMTFYTGGSEKMRITSGGELLIGTTTDVGDFKLQMAGSAHINLSQDSLTRMYIKNINTGSAAYVETTFETANGSGAVGKLGPNISYKTSTSNSTFLYNGASYGDISILNDNTNGKISMATGGSSSAQFTLTSGGNVEIEIGSIKTGEPDTGWGRAAIKIGASVSGEAFDVTRYLPVSVDGTVYYINLNSSTP